MQYFPIFLTGDNINALVIGGGEVAARKLELLLKTSATITLVSASINDRIKYLVETTNIKWLAQDYVPGLMDQANLVIAATNQQEVNQQVAVEANAKKLYVNVVDQPDKCSFITPAIIDRSPIIIALCSSGSAPILLRMLREQIEKLLPQRYGQLADFSGKFRDKVKQKIAQLVDRRKFWEGVLTGPIGQLILNNKMAQAETLFTDVLNQPTPESKGTLSVINVGNGDPDNLTLKAHRAMQFADCVFYANDINKDLLEYVRRDASKAEYAKDVDFAEISQRINSGENVIHLTQSPSQQDQIAALNGIEISSGH